MKKLRIDLIHWRLVCNKLQRAMHDCSPALKLLLFLSDGKPRSSMTLYRLICRERKDTEDLLTYKQLARAYATKYCCSLNKILDSLEASFSIKRIGSGITASYVLSDPNAPIEIEMHKPTPDERMLLSFAWTRLNNGEFFECLDLLEDKLEELGDSAKNSARLYCCYSNLKKEEFEAAVNYWEFIYKCALNLDELALYKKTLRYYKQLGGFR